MENPVSGTRPPFTPSTSQQSDIKQRFYRYFQEEVTGMTFFCDPFDVGFNIIQNCKNR
jgi:hypothetical protein